MISCKMCQLQTFVISTVLGHDALCCYCPIFRGSPCARGGTPRCADCTRRRSQESQRVHHSIWFIMSVVCSPRTHTASPDWPCTLWVQLLMRHMRKHAGRNLLMGTCPWHALVYTKLRSITYHHKRFQLSWKNNYEISLKLRVIMNWNGRFMIGW